MPVTGARRASCATASSSGGSGRAARPVAVISQVSAHAGDDAWPRVQRLCASLVRAGGLQARFVDLGEGRADEEVSAFDGRLDLVVASRLHSGILALCAGTPIVALRRPAQDSTVSCTARDGERLGATGGRSRRWSAGLVTLTAAGLLAETESLDATHTGSPA